ncbi:MAG: hypothetical protein ACKOXP_09865, partial [Flavobacteriales bacterium]
MFKITTLLYLLFSITHFNAQSSNEKPKPSRFSFDYSVGYQYLKMNDLNQYYIDSFALKYQFFNQHIHTAYSRTFQCQYQLSPLFGVGLQTKLDHARITSDIPLYVMDSVGNIINTLNSHNELQVKNVGVGIFGSLNGIELIKRMTGKQFDEKLKMDLQVGTSYHYADVSFTQSSIYSVDVQHMTASTIGGNIQLKLSYPILKKLTSSLRLKMILGYQYAHTKNLQYLVNSGYGKTDWVVLEKYPITANFSGLNAGIGLSYEIKHHDKSTNTPSKNAIYLDILGQSLYGALMYERIQNTESTKVQHGLAVGFMFLNRLPWDYLRVFTLPLSYSAYFDFNRTKN